MGRVVRTRIEGRGEYRELSESNLVRRGGYGFRLSPRGGRRETAAELTDEGTRLGEIEERTSATPEKRGIGKAYLSSSTSGCECYSGVVGY